MFDQVCTVCVDAGLTAAVNYLAAGTGLGLAGKHAWTAARAIAAAVAGRLRPKQRPLVAGLLRQLAEEPGAATESEVVYPTLTVAFDACRNLAKVTIRGKPGILPADAIEVADLLTCDERQLVIRAARKWIDKCLQDQADKAVLAALAALAK